MHPNDAITGAREGTLAGRPPEVLQDMLKSCVCYLSSNRGDPQASYAVMAIRAELESREVSARHQVMVAEQQHLRSVVDSLASGQSAMKQAVDRINRIDMWILIAGAIAALAGVILLFLEFVHGFAVEK